MVDRLDLSYKALKLRKLLNLNCSSYIDVLSLINTIADLTVVYYPFSDNISGVCIKQSSANVIAINSNMTISRQRFSAAHELYHLFFKENATTISLFDTSNRDDVEMEADYFASCFLLPYESLRNELDDGKINLEKLIYIENKYEISHKALLTRLGVDNLISNNQISKLDVQNIKYYVRKYGYDDGMYQKPKYAKKTTYGNYIKQVETLKNLNMISQGKFRELLFSVFRDDLVYDKNRIHN